MSTKDAATFTLLNLAQKDQASGIVSAGTVDSLVVMLRVCGNDGVVQMGGILPLVALMRAGATHTWTIRVQCDRGENCGESLGGVWRG